MANLFDNSTYVFTNRSEKLNTYLHKSQTLTYCGVFCDRLVGLFWFLNLFQSQSSVLARNTNCWVKIFDCQENHKLSLNSWILMTAWRNVVVGCSMESGNFLFIVVFIRYFQQLSVKWQIKIKNDFCLDAKINFASSAPLRISD